MCCEFRGNLSCSFLSSAPYKRCINIHYYDQHTLYENPFLRSGDPQNGLPPWLAPKTIAYRPMWKSRLIHQLQFKHVYVLKFKLLLFRDIQLKLSTLYETIKATFYLNWINFVWAVVFLIIKTVFSYFFQKGNLFSKCMKQPFLCIYMGLLIWCLVANTVEIQWVDFSPALFIDIDFVKKTFKTPGEHQTDIFTKI